MAQQLMTESFAIRKARAYAKTATCPRCSGFILVEYCYDCVSSYTEMAVQFRCVECGWRDDVQQIHALAARELERQQQRRAEHKGFSALGGDDDAA